MNRLHPKALLAVMLMQGARPVGSSHVISSIAPEFMTRLAAFQSPLLSHSGLAALWAGCAAGTLGLVALSLTAARRESSGCA